MSFNTLSIVLGIGAGMIQLYAYWLYNKHVTRPNAVSWGLWAFAAVLEMGSYLAMTEDLVKNILPIACALASIWIFAKAMIKHQFAKPDHKDMVVFWADIAITIVWLMTSALLANVLFLALSFISFIPLLRSVRRGDTDEQALPWAIWTVAYSLMLVSVALRLENWVELLYPITYIVIHGCVWAVVAITERE
jgi:membrane-associated HD superfamily phosphohydrolase